MSSALPDRGRAALVEANSRPTRSAAVIRERAYNQSVRLGPFTWSRRVAAVLLLVWAFCDLTIPGLCQSDNPTTSSAAILQSSPNRAAHVSISEHRDDKSPLTAPSSGDSDDCWCCCSHIVPSVLIVSLGPIFQVPNDLDSYSPDDPRWLASKLFQPPKI